MSDAVFVEPGGGRVFQRANRMTVKVSASQTGGTYELCLEECPPNFESPRHMHLQDYETFYMLSGSATWEIDGEETNVGPGMTIMVPPNTPHQLKTKEGCSMLIIFGPGEQEGQFEELVALTPEQQQDDDIKNEIFARYNRINVPL
jgi:mannose-6-phosphate isomerase-like protein (cupin superfamily)